MSSIARKEMSLVRLSAWHLKLFAASLLRGGRRDLGQRIFFTLLGGFWLAFMGFWFRAMLMEMLRRSPEAGWVPELMLHSAWLGSLAMTLFFNIGFLLHVLFFSRDLSYLMATPVSPVKILTVRFVQAMWANLFFGLFLSLPTTVAVGSVVHAGPLFYLTYVVMLAAFLAVPVATTFLIGIPLARWVSTARLRAVFSVMGFIIAMGLWALPYLAPSRITSYSQWSDLMGRAAALQRFFNSWAAQLLPSTWVSNTLVSVIHGETARTLQLLVGVVAISLGLAVGAVQLGARFYLDGWIRMVPIGETRPVRAERFTFLLAWLPRRWRPVFWKDISVMSRDFRVAFQLYSLGILMCIFPFLTTLGQHSTLPNESRPMAALASALAAAVVVASQAGMMAVPLEGRAGFRLLAAPLKTIEIASTKWLFAVVLTLPIVMAQVAVITFGFGRPVQEALVGAVLSLAGALLGAGFGVFMGAAFGNFQWEHPKRMIRAGAQLGWGMGVGAIVVFLTIIMQVGVFVSDDFLPGLFRPLLPLMALVTAAVIGGVWVVFAARRLARLEWM